jgi:hypothetical protein
MGANTGKNTGKGSQTSKVRKSHAITTAKKAQVALAAGAAAAGPLLHLSPAVAAFTMAMFAVLPEAVGTLMANHAERIRARTARGWRALLEAYAPGEDMTPEQAAAELEGLKDDPNVADAMWRLVRGFMEAPNDAAAEPLGVLAAEYVRLRRPADTFFRGTVRLLSEITETEVADLRGLLGWVLSSTRRSRVTVLTNDLEEHKRPPEVVQGVLRSATTYERVPWYVQLRRDDPDRPEEADNVAQDAWIRFATPPQDAGRLFTLLKASGLGAEPSMGVMGPAILVELQRATVERLDRILRAKGHP